MSVLHSPIYFVLADLSFFFLESKVNFSILDDDSREDSVRREMHNLREN